MTVFGIHLLARPGSTMKSLVLVAREPLAKLVLIASGACFFIAVFRPRVSRRPDSPRFWRTESGRHQRRRNWKSCLARNAEGRGRFSLDRKSTRLNSSHAKIA